MRSDDVALIQRILAGDENAFATLVEKYQQQVHALAFRKVGNFQTAEDITQETFLQVHQKLTTLNDPAKFSGWLYAIVNHLCIACYRKNRLQTESLQEIHISEIEKDVYSRYIATEHAKTTAAAQQDLVRRLLTKLKESDREVITLHYFEEMTSSEIGEFLGVSENTIKSRLHRARQQLKNYDSMIQEALDITIERKHLSQHPLKGEIGMSNEVRNQSEVEAKLEAMQRQITDLQAQIKDIAANSGSSNDSDKREALDALLQLPHNAKDPITWC
ncbi:RNA polymerase sigma factor, partial [Candidatus Poribacteria bacterium]|nr:RNA polymerase sigma factor [Candidatus Poribacteria bacterium]